VIITGGDHQTGKIGTATANGRKIAEENGKKKEKR
jgi:hypothetical protein